MEISSKDKLQIAVFLGSRGEKPLDRSTLCRDGQEGYAKERNQRVPLGAGFCRAVSAASTEKSKRGHHFFDFFFIGRDLTFEHRS